MCDQTLSSNEKLVCSDCIANLPYARISSVSDNFLEEKLRLKIKVESASSLMIYDKRDNNHKLIYLLKYHNRYDIGVTLGEMGAAEMIDSGRFNDIDIIIPVPLHKKRLKERGYNQSMAIAEGISGCMKIPVVDDVVFRHVNNESQTHKDNEQRWSNSDNIFTVNDNPSLNGKHILLVDDVITSGATITGCAKKIMEKYDVKISVFSLATVL